MVLVVGSHVRTNHKIFFFEKNIQQIVAFNNKLNGTLELYYNFLMEWRKTRNYFFCYLFFNVAAFSPHSNNGINCYLMSGVECGTKH